jgi:hypothetical protein
MESILKKRSFYKPTTLSFIASLTNLFAWFSLLLGVVFLLMNLAMLDGYLAEIYMISGHWWEWKNLTSWVVLNGQILPLITDFMSFLSIFFLLKCVAIGLNVLLEIAFTIKANIEGGQDE